MHIFNVIIKIADTDYYQYPHHHAKYSLKEECWMWGVDKEDQRLVIQC